MLVVNVLRARQLEAATGAKSVAPLEVPAPDAPLPGGGTRTVAASGLRTYARNALLLARRGDPALRAALVAEIADAYPAK